MDLLAFQYDRSFLIEALGPELGGRKARHPETGDVTLACPGCHDKNDYGRQTPRYQQHRCYKLVSLVHVNRQAGLLSPEPGRRQRL